MNKKYIVRKNEEIQKIIKKQNKIVSKYFIIYFITNQLGYSRFCISVSKKIGKAHIRNLFKRRVKDIIMKNFNEYSNDYVIILKSNVLDSKYDELKNDLLKYIKKGKNK